VIFRGQIIHKNEPRQIDVIAHRTLVDVAVWRLVDHLPDQMLQPLLSTPRLQLLYLFKFPTINLLEEQNSI
jgi:hypothetical protein